MRICFATKEFPFRTGVGTSVYELAKALQKEGNHVVILTCGREEERKITFHGLPVYEVLPRGFPLSWLLSAGIRIPFTRGKFGIEANDIFSLQAGLRFSQVLPEIIAQENIEIVQFPASFCESYFSLIKKKVPHVLRIDAPRYLWQHIGLSHLPKNPLIEMLEKEEMRLADILTVPSKDMLNNVIKFYNINQERIHLIENLLDINLFSPSEKSDSYLFNDRNKILGVLFVGRIEHLKGIHILAKAIPYVLQEIPDVRFTFIGEEGIDPEEGRPYSEVILENVLKTSKNSRVEAGEEKFQRQIRFVSPLSREMLPEYYRMCSVIVVPSLYESFAYSAIEGMGCGKPVVASRVGGLAEVIEDQITGFLVPPGDWKALAEKIVTILRSDSLRVEMGRRGRARVERLFSPETVVPKVIKLYSASL